MIASTLDGREGRKEGFGGQMNLTQIVTAEEEAAIIYV